MIPVHKCTDCSKAQRALASFPYRQQQYNSLTGERAFPSSTSLLDRNRFFMLRLSIPYLLRIADDLPAVTSGTEVRILGHKPGKVGLCYPDPGGLGCKEQIDFLECALAGFGVQSPDWGVFYVSSRAPRDGKKQ